MITMLYKFLSAFSFYNIDTLLFQAKSTRDKDISVEQQNLPIGQEENQ